MERSLLLEAGPDLVKGAHALMSLAAYPQRSPMGGVLQPMGRVQQEGPMASGLMQVGNSKP